MQRTWVSSDRCGNLLPSPSLEGSVFRGGRLESTKGMGVLSGASVAMALLQSVCTAVLTVNGLRLGIGLTALAAGSIAGPLVPLHRDSIRIPMLLIAAVGAVINLAVLAWIWHLRAQPSSQWRRRDLSPRQRKSERLQVAISILTLLLVGVEFWLHSILHRTPSIPTHAHIALIESHPASSHVLNSSQLL